MKIWKSSNLKLSFPQQNGRIHFALSILPHLSPLLLYLISNYSPAHISENNLPSVLHIYGHISIQSTTSHLQLIHLSDDATGDSNSYVIKANHIQLGIIITATWQFKRVMFLPASVPYVPFRSLEPYSISNWCTDNKHSSLLFNTSIANQCASNTTFQCIQFKNTLEFYLWRFEVDSINIY